MASNVGDIDELPPINFEIDRFPYCIVWTPIPMLTWFFPMIGHMGIGSSRGVIHDFAGPYYVSMDRMAFGRPTRYLQLHPRNIAATIQWDEAVNKASALYGTRMHIICWDNCHRHVAAALNNMRYKGRSNWNMVILCFWLFICGHYVSVGGFLKTWLPFVMFVTACVGVGAGMDLLLKC